ncbi:MAG: pilus assembly protein [Planctomycetota bacterium]|jgi:Flp pilus assembly protein TadG|nr:MAG: pilus assembly protein [Planctomycetota bacterium]
MLRTSSTPLNRRRHRGILSAELLLTLPIMTVLLFGLLEFSLLFFARGDVVEASRAGARAARLYGATEESVEQQVRSSLGGRLAPRARVITSLGDKTGDDVSVAVVVPMAAAAPDLLWLIGYSLKGRELICETHMAKE